MGCPNSKSKSKDLSAENGGNGHVSKTRNDTVRPEEEREPTKHPHEYNDDPLVRGRIDPNQPDVDIDNENNETKSETAGSGRKTTDTQQMEDNASKEETVPRKTQSDVYDTGEKSVSQTKETSQGHDASPKLSSVFIPNDNVDDNASDSIAPSISDNAALELGDINLGGPVVFEVENATINIDEEADNSSDVQVRPVTKATTEVDEQKAVYSADNDDATEPETHKRNSAKESPNIRYQNRDKIQYGLPEGVPEPAPPKSKKADIIKPNAFTIADKIADQAPDLSSSTQMSQLASYLSGETKKADLVTDIDEGQDSEENSSTRQYPLVPPKMRKKEIVPDVAMFKKVDENARNVPESVRLSVEKLAAHLCSVATSDLEKVRAFYVWICNNIGYLYEGDKDDVKRLRFDAVSTLRQGRGSFVNLMSAFCKEASIPVVTIPGCSKGLRHQPDREFAFGERNHSWNAVHVQGEWRLIDCTWGSGYLDSNAKFHPQFDDFWFLTDPEVFAYDHFPSHPTWQLLNEPIDIEDFNKKPSMTERSRELGFKLISHREPIINVDNEVTITFGTETYPLSNITSDFRASDGAEVNRHRCMRRIDDKTFEIRVVPPATGSYMLVLFGKAKDYRHAKYKKLMEYTLRVESIYPEKVVFPTHVKAWGPEPNYSEYGFAKSIENLSIFKTDTNEITIKLDQTKKNVISPELKSGVDSNKELENFTMVTSYEGGVVVHCRFPTSGYYRLDIYAIGPKTEKLEFAAAFLIECTANDSPNMCPKYNCDAVIKHECELLEPIGRELPSETIVSFRLRSARLRQAMIGIPVEEKYGSRLTSLGEMKVSGKVFSGQVKTPAKGQTVLLSGSGAPPNVFWSRIYEFVTV